MSDSKYKARKNKAKKRIQNILLCAVCRVRKLKHIQAHAHTHTTIELHCCADRIQLEYGYLSPTIHSFKHTDFYIFLSKIE